MPTRHITDVPGYPAPHSPYSHAVVANGCAFVSGQIGAVTVLLARPELFKEMNEAYAEFFPRTRPARSVARLGVELPNVLISIEAIATVLVPDANLPTM